jgi:type I restriction enzyme, R subunit
LFVGRKLCGVIEAKAEGTTLSGFSEQAARYIADVPKHLVREEGQVRFEYVASGTETLFRDHADPDPVDRRMQAGSAEARRLNGGSRKSSPSAPRMRPSRER